MRAHLRLGYVGIHVHVFHGSPPAVFFSLKPDLIVIIVVRLFPAIGCAILLCCGLLTQFLWSRLEADMSTLAVLQLSRSRLGV